MRCSSHDSVLPKHVSHELPFLELTPDLRLAVDFLLRTHRNFQADASGDDDDAIDVADDKVVLVNGRAARCDGLTERDHIDTAERVGRMNAGDKRGKAERLDSRDIARVAVDDDAA